MKNLTIITNDNDFNPLYTVVDLSAIKYETRELNISREEAGRKGYKVLRDGFFPHIVVCEVKTEVQGSGWLKTFKNKNQAKKYIKENSK